MSENAQNSGVEGLTLRLRGYHDNMWLICFRMCPHDAQNVFGLKYFDDFNLHRRNSRVLDGSRHHHRRRRVADTETITSKYCRIHGIFFLLYCRHTLPIIFFLLYCRHIIPIIFFLLYCRYIIPIICFLLYCRHTLPYHFLSAISSTYSSLSTGSI